MKYFLPAIAVAILIGYFSVAAKAPLPKEGLAEQSDKAAHFFAYFLLSFSIYWAVLRKNKKISKSQWLWMITASICYGIVLELVQGLLPNDRQFSFLDMIANATGVLVSKFVFKRLFIA